MKLVVTLLVRNEEDIIADNIKFHLRAGADLIIVTDNASEDDTVDKIMPFVRAGHVELFHEPEFTHDQAIWVTKMAHHAASRGADWVINADADEFWWPVSGTLHSVMSNIEASVDILEVQRHNFQPVRADDRTEADFLTRMIYHDTRSVNALGSPLPPKVLHRGSFNLQVEDGNHVVKFLDRTAITQPTRAIEILHFPARSFRQFARKIELGTQALESNKRIMPYVGETWRHVYHQYLKKGRLHDYYASHELTPDVIERRLRNGSIIIDTRLRDFLATSVPAPLATR